VAAGPFVVHRPHALSAAKQHFSNYKAQMKQQPNGGRPGSSEERKAVGTLLRVDQRQLNYHWCAPCFELGIQVVCKLPQLGT
jgi:hypothetical protein